MPFSFSLYLYHLYQQKVRKSFGQNDKVLSQQDIESLLKDPDNQRVLRIFRSAVIDHSMVDEVRYYLCYPVNPLFYHDGFKRAIIADGLVGNVLPSMGPDLTDIISVLAKLTEPDKNPGYVQLLAWHSLGRIVQRYPEFLDCQRCELERALGGPVASVIGALLYCDRLLESSRRRDVLNIFEKGRVKIRFRLQKLMFYYYLSQNVNFVDFPDVDIQQFIVRLKQRDRTLTRQDLYEGLRHIGLFQQNQDMKFWENTPHADVGQRVIRAGRGYIEVVGAYVNGQT